MLRGEGGGVLGWEFAGVRLGLLETAARPGLEVRGPGLQAVQGGHGAPRIAVGVALPVLVLGAQVRLVVFGEVLGVGLPVGEQLVGPRAQLEVEGVRGEGTDAVVPGAGAGGFLRDGAAS